MEKVNISLEKNIEQVKENFNSSEDLVVREIKIKNISASIVFLLGLNDPAYIAQYIIKPIFDIKKLPEKALVEFLKQEVITIGQVEDIETYTEIKKEILAGKAILFIDGVEKAIALGVEKVKERSLEEPPTSAVLKGPRAGFVENSKTNIACIRKILNTADLVTEHFYVGKYTNTLVTVMHIKSIADPKVVKQLCERIAQINIDGIIDSFYVGQFLELRKNSVFKQVGSSEKPDVVCAKMLEGRVAIVVDGSPLVLTLPFILVEDLQSSDDYYQKSARSTFLRLFRPISCFLTVLLPGLYIAIELHHYKTVPLKFLMTIINTTQDLPLTPFSEIIFVLILFEILYEASVRMPKYLGLALSIVGALILGDTAVKAGLISPPAVMIVALSGITLYTVPEQAPQLSILRFIFTMAGGLNGFIGMVLFGIFLIFYLNDFDNYGVAYLAPVAPYIGNDFQDAFTKRDITRIKNRPESIPNINKVRMKK